VVSRHSDEAKQIVAALLAMHGRTYCDELAINIARNTPSVLFRWLCPTLLFFRPAQRKCRHRRRAGNNAEGVDVGPQDGGKHMVKSARMC
jgi:hypothetical protein